MQNWHDWVAYCVGKMEFKQPIHQQSYTIAEDLVCLDTSAQSFPCVPGITGLEMPVFTLLELKSSLLIGGLAKNSSLRKLENF